MGSFIRKNLGISICLASVASLFILMSVFWINKGTYSVDTTSSVALTCSPSEAEPGAIITCDVNLKISNVKVLSVNANYTLDSKLTYTSFTAKGDFETYASSAKGFAIVKTTGVTSNTTVGQIKLKIADDAEAGKTYKIKLTNIELCDDEYNMIELADVEATVTVEAEHEFSTDVYEYNADANYIYTRSDEDAVIISNLGSNDSNIAYSISDGKLILKRSGTVIKEINIIRFHSDYQIMDKVIYLNDVDNTYYSEISQNITSSTVTIKVINKNGTAITDANTIINDDCKLLIMYNNNEIDRYSFKRKKLVIDESLKVNDTTMTIERLKANTSYANLKNYFDTSGTISITNSKGQSVTDSDKIRTGDVLKIAFSDETLEYTLSVLGDVNGSGTVDLSDVIKLHQHNIDISHLTGAYLTAGEVNGNGNVDLSDVIKLHQFILGKISTLEVQK